MKNSLYKAAYCLMLSFTVLPAIAQVAKTNQKLPDQQEVSLRAPAGLKVDGKTNEWNNLFQAYNKTTQVFYTICNDDQNLYLTLQAANSQIINKIISGGLTFSINTNGKKKEKDGVAITFPVPGPNSMRDMMTSMRSGFEKMGPGSDPSKMMKAADSMMYAANRLQIDKLKDLKVVGIKDIPDSMLSIYNEEGIKARALFDNKGASIYELAVPLKYLSVSANDPKEFLYHIKLNGPMASMAGGGMMMGMGGGAPGGGGDRVIVGNGGGGGMGGGPGMVMRSSGGGGGMADIMAMISPTDFWGKYTPAKK